MSGLAKRMTIAAIALSAVGVWMWRTVAPPEEREIRRRLTDLVDEVNTGTTDGLGTVARAARIGQFFSPDVVVELGQGTAPIHGRETLMGMSARLQPRTAAFIMELEDVNVELIESQRGEVTLTLVIRRRGFGTGEESIDAREFSVELEQEAGAWRVSRVTAIDTFR